MRLLWIEAKDFRNHQETRLEAPAGLAVAVGGNGEGKTNLLEAAYYLLSLSSPRTSADLPLVRHGAASAFVRGEVEGLEGRALIEIEVRGVGANRIQVNRSPVRRRRDLRRHVRAVFFSPGDLDIVLGSADARRAFLDEAVVSLWPVRDSLARAYDRALRQRNRLLKEWEGRGAPPELEAWDQELVAAGSALTRARAEAATRVGPRASEEFEALAAYGLHVGYAPSVEAQHAGVPLEDVFRERLRARREDELVRRVTLVGPHRDDLDLAVRDLTARSFASHGEAWAAALALRLGQASAVAEEAGQPPVLLLDDPFPGLDPVRKARLAGRVAGRGQTLMSVADDLHVPDEAEAVWEVQDGRVAVRSGHVAARGGRD
ncbi:MAG: DNA replication and repair protein RecF [Actinomycetota bacterium]|nr:DNA replication and repair protein RecF [Actinomycetota bacterium]